MSQQTQIERVREYWLRWTARWPLVADLAAASEEDVNQVRICWCTHGIDGHLVVGGWQLQI